MPTSLSRLSLERRLLAKIVVSDDGCWYFNGSRDSGGYGLIWDGELRTILKANRAMWMVYNGPIPKDMNVLHTCDNPPCIKPLHLFLGTQYDNMQDMIAKGRGADRVGISNGNAKLTEAQVLEVFELLKEGKLTQAEIGDRYGIAQTAVSYIKRTGWRNLKGEEDADLA